MTGSATLHGVVRKDFSVEKMLKQTPEQKGGVCLGKEGSKDSRQAAQQCHEVG